MDTTRRHADDDPSEEQAFQIYENDPLADGDALLLLDGTVCLELAGLADSWDDLGRRNLVEILTTTSRRVQVAIARERSDLRPDDYKLWRELHESLRDTGVELLPVRALPAAPPYGGGEMNRDVRERHLPSLATAVPHGSSNPYDKTDQQRYDECGLQ